MVAASRRKKSRSSSGNGNGHTARAAQAPEADEDKVVMTLRITPGDRKVLHKYTMALSKSQGRKVSYNAAILEMIRTHA